MNAPNRNDPCPCGSGKKYKQCCLKRDDSFAASKRAEAAFIPNAIQKAIEHHQAGRLSQAETIYRQILQIEANHPDALHFLGVIAYQAGTAFHVQGKLDEAVEQYRQVLSLNPDFAEAHYNLGAALQAQDKPGEAVACYQKALSLNPNFAEAHYNLGVALQAQDQLDEAIACYQKALSFNPDFAEAHNNLAAVLIELGKLDEAVEHCHQALLLKPDFAEAHNNMGIVLRKKGRLDVAVEHCNQALRLKPDYAVAYSNLGIALCEQGKLGEAINLYRKALSLKQNFAEAHSNLGLALYEQGEPDAAIEHCRQALMLKPDFAEAHYNLANALPAQGKLDEAVEHYHQALSLKPDYADAYSNLLFLHSYHAALDPREYLTLACGWERSCVPEQDREAAHVRTFHRAPLAGRRLRVGYVSGDYRQHAMSYFIEQLFARHDRTRIELFAYSTYGQQDAVTGRLQALVDHWIPLTGIPDGAARDRIDADGIDVLIDLSGHTRHNRLGVFARRAAPVQALYLGYFASTGLTEMDYWIGDDILTPAETDSHFSEQVWRLPRVWVSYDGKADAPVPNWKPNRDGTVWVGSFNNLGKLTPQTIALWAKVLHALPEGKLLLKTKELADAGNRQRILDAMAAHGIPLSRVELQRDTNWTDYMSQYNRLDIALDPVGGRGGGTTTCDALWMGVPVIHAIGNCATSRFTASMLDAMGHPEWIARSEAEYIDKVVALARDVERRRALRSDQRAQMSASPLCDARGLAMSLESAYFAMFEQWLKR